VDGQLKLVGHRGKNRENEETVLGAYISLSPFGEFRDARIAVPRKNHGLAVVNESRFLFLFADVVKKHV